jgi:FkbM family methyltransferase
MDTRIDFNTAKKFDQVELVDWKTRYADFKFYVRKGLNEVKYNVGTNVSKGPNSGEYIKPFTSKTMGQPLNINAILNQSDTWLDIGGHLGFFSIRMAKQFPNIKKVISYEALPHNVSFALENIKLNNVEGTCEFVQKAIVPNEDESISFFISSDSGKHSILPVKGRESITVPAININDAIAQTGATAIKMDVEGAEYELIKAVKDWSNIRVVVVEWHFNAMRTITKDKNYRVTLFQEIMSILGKNFDTIRQLPNVEYGKNFITHFVAIKTDGKESL